MNTQEDRLAQFKKMAQLVVEDANSQECLEQQACRLQTKKDDPRSQNSIVRYYDDAFGWCSHTPAQLAFAHELHLYNLNNAT